MDLTRSMVTAAEREGEGSPESIIFNDTEIARDKIKAQLFTQDRQKTYCFHLKKNILNNTLKVYPYAYRP